MIGNGIITNVDLGNKFELGMKLDPTWNFFRKKFEAKRKTSPEKDDNADSEKIYP